MLECKFNPASHTLVCRFSGRLDSQASTELSKTVEQQMAEAARSAAGDASPQDALKVVFDLKEVDFISSLFIRVCLSTAKAASKDNFSITHTDPQVKKVFKIAGLDELLRIS